MIPSFVCYFYHYRKDLPILADVLEDYYPGNRISPLLRVLSNNPHVQVVVRPLHVYSIPVERKRDGYCSVYQFSKWYKDQPGTVLFVVMGDIAVEVKAPSEAIVGFDDAVVAK